MEHICTAYSSKFNGTEGVHNRHSLHLEDTLQKPCRHISTFLDILVAVPCPTVWKVRLKTMERINIRVGWFTQPEIENWIFSKN